MKWFASKEYEITNGKYGLRLILQGPWSEDIERVIHNKKVVELELNSAKGWKRGNDLSFLKRVPDLLCFEIIDFNMKDISDIHCLPNMRALCINTYCRTKIDYSCFKNLEKASLEWRGGAESIFECKTLKDVFINKCNIESLDRFAGLTALVSLSLKSPRIKCIGDITSLKKLTFLGIYYAKYLKSLDGIENMTGLKRLEIDRCNQIGNINAISALKNLEYLLTADNGPIESLAPLRELANLKEVHFHESTNILDGNLALLKQLPHLRDVSFQERKHYNCKREDLPSRDTKEDHGVFSYLS